MKHTTTLVLALLISLSAMAQRADVDTTTININTASMQLTKTANLQEASIWWGVIGSAFTILASDQSAKVYDHNLAVGLGIATVGGFATLQILGANHTRKAARLLHQ